MEELRPDARELLERRQSAWSGIIGPDGRAIEGITDEEGIVTAEIDLNRCIQPRQMHDVTGHYNRFDVLRLSLDRSDRAPLHAHDPNPEPLTQPTGDDHDQA
jgi:aliphatic nitrilase